MESVWLSPTVGCQPILWTSPEPFHTLCCLQPERQRKQYQSQKKEKIWGQFLWFSRCQFCNPIYFGAHLISIISVQAFFTEIKSLLKFQLRVDECSCLFKVVWIPLTLPKFSPYRTGVFSLYRKLYATEIKVDYMQYWAFSSSLFCTFY